ncbi:MAG: hypothetical protein Q7K98_05725 [Candidatus Omnitrophota bacterium]|nr:hypothetical protein [Candidatus Omnitrophota bacterium]
MKKSWVLIVVALVLFFTTYLSANDVRFTRMGTPPEPRLLYPIYDTAILFGNNPLEFRWFNTYIGTDHFIFKIYRGYSMYESALIYKQNISPGESSIKIKADLFDDSQIYTWSLIRVAFGGEKSDKSFNSFKVIKK